MHCIVQCNWYEAHIRNTIMLLPWTQQTTNQATILTNEFCDISLLPRPGLSVLVVCRLPKSRLPLAAWPCVVRLAACLPAWPGDGQQAKMDGVTTGMLLATPVGSCVELCDVMPSAGNVGTSRRHPASAVHPQTPRHGPHTIRHDRHSSAVSKQDSASAADWTYSAWHCWHCIACLLLYYTGWQITS